MYTDRFYRKWVEAPDLFRFGVKVGESDLWILSDGDLHSLALATLKKVRAKLERYAKRDPAFLKAYEPREPKEGAPSIARTMADAANAFGVGPLAGVAGAIAQTVGRKLAARADTVIVENGGDIWARSEKPVRFVLYAGEDSPFSGRVAFEVDARQGVGVCTSSGVVGPSVSFGRADAFVAVARDAAFADAAATAYANRIRRPKDVGPVVEALGRRESARPRLLGFLACAGNQIGLWGDLQLKGGTSCSRA
ncbi:MAG: UPF0280 family protein [Planctomycetota bacterium]|jgi:ApbE superfamily uncharacterized protein (UPF0280 family)